MIQAYSSAAKVGAGFPRSYRLLKAGEFASVFSFRRSYANAYFQVWSRPNELGFARVGVVVAKRIVRQAVFRNRIKRMTRELFRHHAADFSGIDLVVRAKKPLYRNDTAAARAALLLLFSRYTTCRVS